MMAEVPLKYQKATLPAAGEAIPMATEREQWAAEAIERLQYGSAREFELTALLLRFYEEHKTEK